MMIKKEYIRPEISKIAVLTENLLGNTISADEDPDFGDADGFMAKEENWDFTDTDDLDGWEPYRSCLWTEDETE